MTLLVFVPKITRYPFGPRGRITVIRRHGSRYGRSRLEGSDVTDIRLAPGDPAPSFTLPDADGAEVSLESLRGQRAIIYFSPAAMTPGCTTQGCDFRVSKAALSDA